MGTPIRKAVAERARRERKRRLHFPGDLIYRSGLATARAPQFRTKFYDL
jgi:hypothetical protein